MLSPHDIEFSRNLGCYSVEEQARFNGSVVSVAGAGGDGGELAIQLARLGIGEIRLADPDPFEAENTNRQAACTTETLGVNKAVAVGNEISRINPGIKVVTYTDGITPGNVAEFVKGADLVIDETEFTLHTLGVMLARQARKEGIPDLMAMNIGFGATVTAFHPNGPSFERFLGLSEDDPLVKIARTKVPITRWLSYLPPYADLEVFEKVAKGEKSAPSVVQGVGVAASMAATQAGLHLTADIQNNRPHPVFYPHVLMFDTMTGESRPIKHPRASSYKFMLQMLINNKLHRVPRASY